MQPHWFGSGFHQVEIAQINDSPSFFLPFSRLNFVICQEEISLFIRHIAFNIFSVTVWALSRYHILDFCTQKTSDLIIKKRIFNSKAMQCAQNTDRKTKTPELILIILVLITMNVFKQIPVIFLQNLMRLSKLDNWV